MDKYSRLRPFVESELCACDTITELLLIDLFTANPLHCMVCQHEVALSRLNLSVSLIDEVANWRNVLTSLHRLWLDSGDYEAWAKAQLLDKDGQVNKMGLALAKRLAARYPTWYWWFHDADDGERDSCPNCAGPLDPEVRHGTGKCESCRVVI